MHNHIYIKTNTQQIYAFPYANVIYAKCKREWKEGDTPKWRTQLVASGERDGFEGGDGLEEGRGFLLLSSHVLCFCISHKNESWMTCINKKNKFK